MSQNLSIPTFKMTSHSNELVRRVVTRLKSRFGGQMRDIDIAIQREGLILRGRVATYYGKQMAQEVTAEVTGLTVAFNDIKVQAKDSLLSD